MLNLSFLGKKIHRKLETSFSGKVPHNLHRIKVEIHKGEKCLLWKTIFEIKEPSIQLF